MRPDPCQPKMPSWEPRLFSGTFYQEITGSSAGALELQPHFAMSSVAPQVVVLSKCLLFGLCVEHGPAHPCRGLPADRGVLCQGQVGLLIGAASAASGLRSV